MEPSDDPAGAAYSIWDELADYAGSEVVTALEHLLTRLCQHTSSQGGYWLGAVRVEAESPGDPLYGWRPRVIHYLEKDPERVRYSKRRIRQVEHAPVDTSMQAHARLAGAFRAFRLDELAPSGWRDTGYARELQAVSGMRDIIYVTMPLSADMESYIQLERRGESPLYTAADRDFAAYVVRGIRWFHLQLALAFGLGVSESPLTDAERRVLHELLTDKSEKRIARELGLTASTTRSYVRDICRKFNVKGRIGLLALWFKPDPEIN